MSYSKSVYEDAKQYLTEWWQYKKERYVPIASESDFEDIRQKFEDDCFVCDQVTGNASGSYTFNRLSAKEFVLSEMEIFNNIIAEGLLEKESFADYIINEDWEALDVTARCYFVNTKVYEIFEEIVDAYKENDIDTLKEFGFDESDLSKKKMSSNLNIALKIKGVDKKKWIVSYSRNSDIYEFFYENNLTCSATSFKGNEEQWLKLERDRFNIAMTELAEEINKAEKRLLLYKELYRGRKKDDEDEEISVNDIETQAEYLEERKQLLARLKFIDDILDTTEYSTSDVEEVLTNYD